MDWAARRRTTALAILGSMGFAVLLILVIAVVYRVPSCTDGSQNQNETGVDCGGSCPRACTLEMRPAVVEFVRPLAQANRTDVVMYIRNPNMNAYAQAAPVTIELYGTDGLLTRTQISIYLPAGSTVPVFVPGVLAEERQVTQAFATIDDPSWFTVMETPPQAPRVAEVETRDQSTRPRIVARVENERSIDQFRVPVVVTVFDASGTAIAASRTIIERLPAQGSATAIFTWPAPWPAPAARVEVMPLPAPPSVAALLGA